MLSQVKENIHLSVDLNYVGHLNQRNMNHFHLVLLEDDSASAIHSLLAQPLHIHNEVK